MAFRPSSHSRRSFRGLVIFLCIVAVVITAVVSFRLRLPGTDAESLEIHFLDVGQADSALIVHDGHTVMIDTGYRDNGAYLHNVLNQYGGKLSCLILTHPHSDHIGGALYILEHCDVEMVILPVGPGGDTRYEAVLDEIERQSIPTKMMQPGDGFQMGQAKFTFLAPLAEYSSENDGSYVIRLDYGEISALFTGDAESDSERDQLSLYGSGEGGYLDVDILKVGHHGSASSTTERYLAAVTPAYAVISCGAGNDYGHPHREVLLRLSQAGSLILRTDLAGDISFRTDGETIELISE